ncbi:MAG: inosine monophosphate cyclohydrolase [Ruminococcaceae bacterium]|nr:inosine monophosphate cyclohydrolase [Oscillospiraceae bacterium]
MDIYTTQTAGELLKGNSYAGRGIIIGKSADGKRAMTVYFIMGRSQNSRNRIFAEKDNGEVIIYPHDYSKVEDPSLIIYSPIRVYENKLIVTNGDQTDTIYDALTEGKTFEDALDSREFEPDRPNWTPRISGMLTFDKGDFKYKMSILKSADAEGSACNRFTYSYSPIAGVGHFIHTYVCDGSPLPTFQGEPERLSIPDYIEEFAKEVWENLNEENKISLYARSVDLASGEVWNVMINKHEA